MSEQPDEFIFVNNSNATFSNNNSVMTVNFSPSFVPRNQSMALFDFFIYYSWFNVNAQAYNNNTFSWKFNGTTYNVTLPNGYYATSDINGYMELSMYTNGIYLLDSFGNIQYIWSIVANPVYYANTITATVYGTLPSGWSNPNSIPLNTTVILTFNGSNFNQLLGFNQNTSYPATAQSSTYQVNSTITPEISPVNSVKINCNMAEVPSMFNNTLNTIYQFSSSNYVFGSQIQLTPQLLRWCKCYNNTSFNFMTISLTDQDNNPIYVNDISISATFALKKNNPALNY
jgi:hypothetical protein